MLFVEWPLFPKSEFAALNSMTSDPFTNLIYLNPGLLSNFAFSSPNLFKLVESKCLIILLFSLSSTSSTQSFKLLKSKVFKKFCSKFKYFRLLSGLNNIGSNDFIQLNPISKWVRLERRLKVSAWSADRSFTLMISVFKLYRSSKRPGGISFNAV